MIAHRLHHPRRRPHPGYGGRADRGAGDPCLVAGCRRGLFAAVCCPVRGSSGGGLGRIHHRGSDQRLASFTSGGLTFVTYLGLAVAGPQIAVGPSWANRVRELSLMALSLFSHRTVNYPQAASLSGTAQCVGYGLAAAGPVRFGGLRDVSGGLALPLLVTAGLMAVLVVTGLLAGRDRVISACRGSDGRRLQESAALLADGLSRDPPICPGW